MFIYLRFTLLAIIMLLLDSRNSDVYATTVDLRLYTSGTQTNLGSAIHEMYGNYVVIIARNCREGEGGGRVERSFKIAR